MKSQYFNVRGYVRGSMSYFYTLSWKKVISILPSGEGLRVRGFMESSSGIGTCTSRSKVHVPSFGFLINPLNPLNPLFSLISIYYSIYLCL